MADNSNLTLSNDVSEYNSNFSFNNSVPCNLGSELLMKSIFCNSEYSKVVYNFISFFELDEIVNLRLSCKSFYKTLNKKVIKKYVREGKITPKNRLKFWTSNIDFYLVQKQVEKKISDINCFSDSLYEKINISYVRDAKSKVLCKTLIGYINVIKKDLARTVIYENNTKMNEEINAKLERILVMTAYIRPEIGYCQGMNFVAVALLHFLGNEELSFWLFITLLDKFELNLLYSQVIF